MSDSTATETASETGKETAQTTTEASAGPKPPWGSDADFNPAKAWALVQNLRSDNAEKASALETAREKAADVDKFRTKAQEAEDAAQETALSLHRERAARTHGLSDEQFEFLAELTDPEAIATRAEKLAAMVPKSARAVDPAQGAAAETSADPRQAFAKFMKS